MTADWSTRADVAQHSLDHFFGTDEPQLLNRTYPSEPGDNETFNYWWLAHVIGARLDAFERSGDEQWLKAAVRTHSNILARNDGSPFNDFFDDMLWFGLAILRLYDATADAGYLDDAEALWDHVVEFGWNAEHGYSVASSKDHLHYKNMTANGPFIILACRLSQHITDPRYLELAQTAHTWLTTNLVDDDTGFVSEGLNRERDGRIDTPWRFSYNQGLYVGAAVELGRARHTSDYMEQASRTALTAIDRLGSNGVFRDEGDGGDEGLFKGLFHRNVGFLLADLDRESPTARELARFIRSSTDALWANSRRGEFLLAGNDWSAPPSGKVAYSTQLSAITALEVRARLDGD